MARPLYDPWWDEEKLVLNKALELARNPEVPDFTSPDELVKFVNDAGGIESINTGRQAEQIFEIVKQSRRIAGEQNRTISNITRGVVAKGNLAALDEILTRRFEQNDITVEDTIRYTASYNLAKDTQGRPDEDAPFGAPPNRGAPFTPPDHFRTATTDRLQEDSGRALHRIKHGLSPEEWEEFVQETDPVRSQRLVNRASMRRPSNMRVDQVLGRRDPDEFIDSFSRSERKVLGALASKEGLGSVNLRDVNTSDLQRAASAIQFINYKRADEGKPPVWEENLKVASQILNGKEDTEAFKQENLTPEQMLSVGLTQSPTTFGEYASSFRNSFVRGGESFAKGMLISGPRAFTDLIRGDEADLAGMGFTDFELQMRSFTDNPNKFIDPSHESAWMKFMVGTLPSAVGSSIPILVAGSIGGAPGAVAVFAAGTLGATGMMYDEARYARSPSGERLFDSQAQLRHFALAGTMTGALEMVGARATHGLFSYGNRFAMARRLGREGFSNPTGLAQRIIAANEVAPWAMGMRTGALRFYGTNFATEFMVEGTTEGLQTINENLAMITTGIDAERAWTQGMGEAMLAGGIVGGTLFSPIGSYQSYGGIQKTRAMYDKLRADILVDRDRVTGTLADGLVGEGAAHIPGTAARVLSAVMDITTNKMTLQEASDDLARFWVAWPTNPSTGAASTAPMEAFYAELLPKLAAGDLQNIEIGSQVFPMLKSAVTDMVTDSSARHDMALGALLDAAQAEDVEAGIEALKSLRDRDVELQELRAQDSRAAERISSMRLALNHGTYNSSHQINEDLAEVQSLMEKHPAFTTMLTAMEGALRQKRLTFERGARESSVIIVESDIPILNGPDTTVRRANVDDTIPTSKDGLQAHAPVANTAYQKAVERDPARHEEFVKKLKGRGLSRENIPQALMIQLADTHDAAVHQPDNPAVQEAYDALYSELLEQLVDLMDTGIIVEESNDTNRHLNSADMMQSLRDGGVIRYDSTKEHSQIPLDHPMLRRVLVNHPNWRGNTEVTINDIFRVVHDVMGHAAHGNQFGPLGEYFAYLSHAATLSDPARRALAAETLGQNAWFNYGAQVRTGPDRMDVAQPGQNEYIPPSQRPFATQKAYLMPDEFTFPERSGQSGWVDTSTPLQRAQQEGALIGVASPVRSQVDLAYDDEILVTTGHKEPSTTRNVSTRNNPTPARTVLDLLQRGGRGPMRGRIPQWAGSTASTMMDPDRSPLSKSQYVVISAAKADLSPDENQQRHEAMFTSLRELGYDPIPVTGKDGEKGFVVPGMWELDGLSLAASFQQEYVLSPMGRIGIDGTSQKADVRAIREADPDEDHIALHTDTGEVRVHIPLEEKQIPFWKHILTQQGNERSIGTNLDQFFAHLGQRARMRMNARRLDRDGDGQGVLFPALMAGTIGLAGIIAGSDVDVTSATTAAMMVAAPVATVATLGDLVALGVAGIWRTGRSFLTFNRHMGTQVVGWNALDDQYKVEVFQRSLKSVRTMLSQVFEDATVADHVRSQLSLLNASAFREALVEVQEGDRVGAKDSFETLAKVYDVMGDRRFKTFRDALNEWKELTDAGIGVGDKRKAPRWEKAIRAQKKLKRTIQDPDAFIEALNDKHIRPLLAEQTAKVDEILNTKMTELLNEFLEMQNNPNVYVPLVWYRQVTNWVHSVVGKGPDAEMLLDMLAVFSINSTVQDNAVNAIAAFAHFKAGRGGPLTSDMLPGGAVDHVVAMANRAAEGHIFDHNESVEGLAIVEGIAKPLSEAIAAGQITEQEAQRALLREISLGVEGRGTVNERITNDWSMLKISMFRAALGGVESAVAVDRWVLRAFDLPGVNKMNGPTSGLHMLIWTKARDIANNIQLATGLSVSPADVQAYLWDKGFQASPAPGTPETGSFPEIIEDFRHFLERSQGIQSETFGGFLEMLATRQSSQRELFSGFAQSSTYRALRDAAERQGKNLPIVYAAYRRVILDARKALAEGLLPPSHLVNGIPKALFTDPNVEAVATEMISAAIFGPELPIDLFEQLPDRQVVTAAIASHGLSRPFTVIYDHETQQIKVRDEDMRLFMYAASTLRFLPIRFESGNVTNGQQIQVPGRVPDKQAKAFPPSVLFTKTQPTGEQVVLQHTYENATAISDAPITLYLYNSQPGLRVHDPYNAEHHDSNDPGYKAVDGAPVGTDYMKFIGARSMDTRKQMVEDGEYEYAVELSQALVYDMKADIHGFGNHLRDKLQHEPATRRIMMMAAMAGYVAVSDGAGQFSIINPVATRGATESAASMMEVIDDAALGRATKAQAEGRLNRNRCR